MAVQGDIPPVPVPPPGAAVPPVEPAPAAPVPTSAASAVPVIPDPYAAPLAQPDPSVAYSEGFTRPVQPTPYTHGYGQPGYTPPLAAPAQGLSIASMVLGIGGLLLTFFGFGFLAAVAAVITGHMAQRRQPYAKAFWLTGIITGYVGLGISLLIGLFAVLILVAAIGGASYFG